MDPISFDGSKTKSLHLKIEIVLSKQRTPHDLICLSLFAENLDYNTYNITNSQNKDN